MELDYSIPIPKEMWGANKLAGKLVSDAYNGKKLKIYLPPNYDPEKPYDVFYFKMGTNNSADQFWTYPGYTSHFEYVIDNLIAAGKIKPLIICSIQGNAPNQGWIQYNAYGLICHVEGLYLSYAMRDPAKIIESAPHRALGGWSLGSIEDKTLLVNGQKNDFWKFFKWYDLQSGYNASGLNTVSRDLFIGIASGGNDDGGCKTFATQAKAMFEKDPTFIENVNYKVQIVPKYTHAINFQLNYFYNAVQFFFHP